MARAFLRGDIDLLGYEPITDRDYEVDTSSFSVIKASVRAGLERVQSTFVYVKAACTVDDLAKAGAYAKSRTNSYVVYSRSTKDRVPKLREAVGSGVKCLEIEDLIWGRIKETFLSYLNALEDGIQPPNPYVTPRPVNQPEADLEEIMLNWLRETETEPSSHIRVICAPAGVGKTSLARHLTRRVAKGADGYRLIPCYVESDHWAKLRVESLDQLWAMIENSLRHFDPSLRLTQSLFEHLLKSGDLVFIFDGFDELCGHNRCRLSPREVLSELHQLAKESSAKIILTTRTMYWETEVGQVTEASGLGLLASDVRVFHLEQFTKPQAHDFFERRFQKRHSLREKAHLLLDQVSAANQPPTPGGGKKQITYHPYIVEMVASAVAEGVERIPDASPGNLMLKLLHEMCVREQVRRKLETPPKEQLAAFEAIAVDRVNSGIVEFDDDICIIAGFREHDRARLKDHPLIDAKAETEGMVFRFRYDFLPHILTARHLVRAIAEGIDKAEPLAEATMQLMEREGVARGIVLEHMCNFWESADFERLAKCYQRIDLNRGLVRSFLFHFGNTLVNNRLKPVTKRERADLIFSLFGGITFASSRVVKGLHVRGTIEKLDLSNVSFEHCTFVDAVFADCAADGNTRFSKCRFIGPFDIFGADRATWAKAPFPVDSETDPSVGLVWEDLQEGEDGGTEEVARALMRLGLGKFWHHGRLKRSIAKKDWKKGFVGRHGSGIRILRAMLKVKVLEEIRISGVSEGGYAFVSDVGELQQFMDNGSLTGAIREVFPELTRSRLG